MPRARTVPDWVDSVERREPPDPSTCDLCKGEGCQHCDPEHDLHEPSGEDE